EFVHAPGQRHRASAWNETERWTKSGAAAARGRGRNRAESFRADAERDTAGCGSGSRSGGRAAGTLMDVPRIPGDAAKPVIALCKRAECQFCDEDRTGIV